MIIDVAVDVIRDPISCGKDDGVRVDMRVNWLSLRCTYVRMRVVGEDELS